MLTTRFIIVQNNLKSKKQTDSLALDAFADVFGHFSSKIII